ncbi:hypothetical protein Ancab_019199 [Ancistrocladus abbreviatus]
MAADDGGGLKFGSTGNINLSPSPRGGGEDEVIDLTGHVNYLPCCVKFTGPASVSHYFKPKPTGVEVDGMIVEEAFFRGRKLQGTTIPVPEGYSGFILGKKNDKANKTPDQGPDKGKASVNLDGNSNDWEMLAKYRTISFWNHDSLPSKDDACLRSFHWFAVSKALHEPVNAEDLEISSITKEQTQK